MNSWYPRCCTTRGAAVFWAGSFLLMYGAGLLATWRWPALETYDSALLLLALGAACVTNAIRNGTYHCGVTGPLFLVLAPAAALDAAGILRISLLIVWSAALLGTGAALLLEARFTVRQRTYSGR